MPRSRPLPRHKTDRRSASERETATRVNRALWERQSDGYDRRFAPVLGGAKSAAWGLWRIPERQLRLLGPVRGRRVLEVGCGGGRWAVALAARGARVLGVDFSRAQLRHARRVARRARRRIPLILASVERLPLAAASCDVVFCDWGALTFADPRVGVPECARVLRRGGRLVFATMSPLRAVATSAKRGTIGRRFQRSYFDLHRLDFPREVNHTLPYGEWVQLFAANGLQVRQLLEPAAPTRSSAYLTPREERWARRWPMEVIWVTEKSDRGSTR